MCWERRFRCCFQTVIYMLYNLQCITSTCTYDMFFDAQNNIITNGISSFEVLVMLFIFSCVWLWTFRSCSVRYPIAYPFSFVLFSALDIFITFDWFTRISIHANRRNHSALFVSCSLRSVIMKEVVAMLKIRLVFFAKCRRIIL